MLQLFCSDIQDGHHGSYLDNLDIQKCYNCSDIQDGHHGSYLGNKDIQKCYNIVLFWYPRVLPRWPSWQLSRQHGHSEMLKLFCSDIRDGNQYGSYLGNMDIQKCYNCSVPIFKMATMWHVRILQMTPPANHIFRLNWNVVGKGTHHSILISKMATMAAILFVCMRLNVTFKNVLKFSCDWMSLSTITEGSSGLTLFLTFQY